MKAKLEVVIRIPITAMSPYYTVHKPGHDRRRGSYVHHYICANQQMKGRAQCGHSNRILANVSEGWIRETRHIESGRGRDLHLV